MSQPVDTTETENVPATETQEVQGTSDKKEMTPDELRAELAKVRSEAAARRVANRELEEKAKKWSEYEESQKTELQKLQDQLAAKDKAVEDAKLDVKRAQIAKKFNVADDDLDLLVGDEENMTRLAERLGKKEDTTRTPADLLAGTRGKPVGGSSNNFSMEDFIRGNVK